MDATFKDIRVVMEKGLENFKIIGEVKIESQNIQKAKASSQLPAHFTAITECHIWGSGVVRISADKIASNAIVHSMSDIFSSAVHKAAAPIIGFSSEVLINLDENYVQVGFSISCTASTLKDVAKTLTNEIVEQVLIS